MRSIPNHTPYLRPTEERITQWLAWSSTTGRFTPMPQVVVTQRVRRIETINYYVKDAA